MVEARLQALERFAAEQRVNTTSLQSQVHELQQENASLKACVEHMSGLVKTVATRAQSGGGGNYGFSDRMQNVLMNSITALTEKDKTMTTLLQNQIQLGQQMLKVAQQGPAAVGK